MCARRMLSECRMSELDRFPPCNPEQGENMAKVQEGTLPRHREHMAVCSSVCSMSGTPFRGSDCECTAYRLCSELGGDRWQAIRGKAALHSARRCAMPFLGGLLCAVALICLQVTVCAPARLASAQWALFACVAKSFRTVSRILSANYLRGVYYLAICKATGSARMLLRRWDSNQESSRTAAEGSQ